VANLIYVAIQSLDGYIADENGKFEWGEPDEETHTFVNDLTRPIGTYLYGRRLYEVMLAWEDIDLAGQPTHIRDFAAIWQEADKVVYSRTLTSVSSVRTTIEREFDPAAIRQMKATAPRNLTVGGAELAAVAFQADLVDECHLFLAPVILGDGTRSLPDGVRRTLELMEERRFGHGTVYLAYRVARS
jgi:dihydrofolate reductase